MKREDFKATGFYAMSNWGGLEVMVESEDYVRYRAVFSKEQEETARPSRPCKICINRMGRAYFNYKGTRIFLDEVMNSSF